MHLSKYFASETFLPSFLKMSRFERRIQSTQWEWIDLELCHHFSRYVPIQLCDTGCTQTIRNIGICCNHPLPTSSQQHNGYVKSIQSFPETVCPNYCYWSVIVKNMGTWSISASSVVGGGVQAVAIESKVFSAYFSLVHTMMHVNKCYVKIESST